VCVCVCVCVCVLPACLHKHALSPTAVSLHTISEIDHVRSAVNDQIYEQSQRLNSRGGGLRSQRLKEMIAQPRDLRETETERDRERQREQGAQTNGSLELISLYRMCCEVIIMHLWCLVCT
jgi:hypothetical protein